MGKYYFKAKVASPFNFIKPNSICICMHLMEGGHKNIFCYSMSLVSNFIEHELHTKPLADGYHEYSHSCAPKLHCPSWMEISQFLFGWLPPTTIWYGYGGCIWARPGKCCYDYVIVYRLEQQQRIINNIGAAAGEYGHIVCRDSWLGPVWFHQSLSQTNFYQVQIWISINHTHAQRLLIKFKFCLRHIIPIR